MKEGADQFERELRALINRHSLEGGLTYREAIGVLEMEKLCMMRELQLANERNDEEGS